MKWFCKNLAFTTLLVILFGAIMVSWKMTGDGFKEFSYGDINLGTLLFMIVILASLNFVWMKTYEAYRLMVIKKKESEFMSGIIKANKAEFEREKKRLNGRIAGFLNTIEYLKVSMAQQAKALATPKKVEYANFDDWAVDEFAKMMKAKMAYQRQIGWHGWTGANPEILKRKLQSQAHRGEPRFSAVDTANYAMFLWIIENFPAACEDHELVLTATK
jgi:hypothetical protein